MKIIFRRYLRRPPIQYFDRTTTLSEQYNVIIAAFLLPALQQVTRTTAAIDNAANVDEQKNKIWCKRILLCEFPLNHRTMQQCVMYTEPGDNNIINLERARYILIRHVEVSSVFIYTVVFAGDHSSLLPWPRRSLSAARHWNSTTAWDAREYYILFFRPQCTEWST